MLGVLSVAYPDRKDVEILGKLRLRSAAFGRQKGIWSTQHETNFAGFDICKTGLRVFESTPIGPSGTFFAPWADIRSERRRLWIICVNVELIFGGPEIGTVTISSRTAERIAALSGGRFVLPGIEAL